MKTMREIMEAADILPFPNSKKPQPADTDTQTTSHNGAEELLRAIVAAWDEPHYGDHEAVLDNLSGPIAAARKFLDDDRHPK